MDRPTNCMSTWFPRLLALKQDENCPVVINLPKTELVDATNVDFSSMFKDTGDRGKPAESYYDLVDRIKAAMLRISPVGPWFLRTGHTSSKHDFSRSCFVTNTDKLNNHIFALVEFSECAGFLGLPYNWFAVREYLKTDHDFTAFKGLPISREFRVFVEDGKIICRHPYWPMGALEGYGANPTSPMWQDQLAEHHKIDSVDASYIQRVAAEISNHFEGAWSIDFLHCLPKKDHPAFAWYVTDMARAEDSFHWTPCAKAKKRKWPQEKMRAMRNRDEAKKAATTDDDDEVVELVQPE